MTFPTIHMNGTDARDLLDNQMKAMHAVREAIRALHQIEPHGRDYYPQAAGALYKAQEEHAGRILALLNVLEELDAIAANIVEQGESRV